MVIPINSLSKSVGDGERGRGLVRVDGRPCTLSGVGSGKGSDLLTVRKKKKYLYSNLIKVVVLTRTFQCFIIYFLSVIDSVFVIIEKVVIF
jgi:hypothetical protein